MKKVIKYIWYAALAIFFAAVLFRIFLFKSSDILNDITPTDNARAAYAENGDFLTNRILQELSEDGYSRVYSFVYIPEKGEVQLTVKYNMNLMEKVRLESADALVFKLYDAKNETEYIASERKDDSRGLYGYSRLVFENVTVREDADLELVICGGAEDEYYSCFRVRKASQEFEPYKLSKDEIKSLEQ